MRRKLIAYLIFFLLPAGLVSACGSTDRRNDSGISKDLEVKPDGVSEITIETEQTSEQEILEAEQTQAEEEQTQPTEEEEDMCKMQIIVGNQVFTAELYDNETAKALAEHLPMTLDMSELNGNEKYYYLDYSLPTDSKCPSQIHVGDIMLYGLDCLVVFYDSFSTRYSYTQIGRVTNVEGLDKALGNGNVQVTFQAE